MSKRGHDHLSEATSVANNPQAALITHDDLDRQMVEKWMAIRAQLTKAEAARLVETETFSNIDRVHSKILKFPEVWSLKAGRKCRKLYLQAVENGSEQLQVLRGIESKIKELLVLQQQHQDLPKPVKPVSPVHPIRSSPRSPTAQLPSKDQEQQDQLRKRMKVLHSSPPLKPIPAPTIPAILQEGTLVAAQIPKEGQLVWILAVIIDYNASTDIYECEDAETDRDSPDYQRRYQVKNQGIVRLPNPSECDTKQFKKDTIVLALYPDTSCFYEAVVVDSTEDVLISTLFVSPSFNEEIFILNNYIYVCVCRSMLSSLMKTTTSSGSYHQGSLLNRRK